MAIEIQQEQEGAVRILGLAGRLDTETAVDVELTLQDLLAAGERHFLIDLSGIGYVSSAGLRVLLALAKQLDGGKGSLRLCGLNAAVNQVFEVAGFSKLFAIFRDRAAALRDQPKIKPDAALAQKTASLIGATTTAAAAASPEAAELARAAAKLLGIKSTLPPPPKPAAAIKPAAVAPPNPVVAPSPAAVPVAAPQGVMGKLRGLFGGKR